MINIYITHVQDFGPFLKIFGQTNKSDALKIEKAVEELLPILTTSPQLQELHIGTICLGKYSDGHYYRSRITGIGINGLINVYFLDYGNEDVIHYSQIRLLNSENPYAAFLKSTQPQANDFILARIILENLSIEVLEHIRAEICNESVEAKMDTKVLGFVLISLTFKGQDYSETLFHKKFCSMVHIDNQCDMILRKATEAPPAQVASIQTSIPTTSLYTLPLNSKPYAFYHHPMQQQPTQLHMQPSILMPNLTTGLAPLRPNVPVAMLRPTYNPFSNQQVRQISTPLYAKKYIRLLKQQENQQPKMTVAHSVSSMGSTNKISTSSASSSVSSSSSSGSTKMEVATFKSKTLNIGTSHEVFCSHIEDGPNLFSIQLASSKIGLIELVEALTKLVERSHLKHLREKPSTGMACIVQDVKNKKYHRAIIMKITAKNCKVLYVDYGSSEYVTYECVYEIPVTFLKKEIFAMKFTLSGYKELQPINEILRNKFKELVLNKKLLLKVTPLEGAPFVQYCELYDGTKSIFKELQNTTKIIKPKQKLKYFPAMDLQKSGCYNITIRYVESPQKFFVQIIDQANDCEIMMDRLLEFCQHAGPVTEFNYGTVCAAKFDENEHEWYRAEVIRMMNGSKVLIKYIDFGNQQEVECKLLREISKEFISLPAQAIECCLKGFENLSDISDAARIQLEMFSEDEKGSRKTLNLYVHEKLESNILLVNLFDNNFSPPLNISKRMYILSTPQRQTTPFQFDQYSKSNCENEILNSTAVESNSNSHGNNNFREKAVAFTSSKNDTSGNDSWKVNNGDDNSWKANNNNGTNDSWKGDNNRTTDTWKGDNNKTTDSWKGDNNRTTDSWKGNKNNNATSDSWKLNGSNRNDNYQDKRDNFNKFSNNRNESYNKPKYPNDNERTTKYQHNDYNRGEKYINTKKLIPRFNKQIINSSDNSSKGDKYNKNKDDSSESSGRFSWSNDYCKKRSDERNEYDTSAHNSNSLGSFEPPIEVEYFVPFDTPYSKPEYELNEKIQVQMQWWISPYHFYVQLNKYEIDFENMVKNMQTFYKNCKTAEIKPSIGDTIVACSVQNKIFCRATVLNYNEELQKFKIQFVDFGNTAIITMDNVWQMEQRFMTLPQLAIKCCLTKSVLQTTIDHIMEVIGNYIPTNSNHECEFETTEDGINYVNYYINGNSLFERFSTDELITAIPSNINLHRLIGQTIQAKYKKIVSFNEFYIQIDGLEIAIPCSYAHSNKFNQTELNEKIEEFRTICESNYSAVKVENVTEHLILQVVPQIALLEEAKRPIICDYPIMSNYCEINVTSVESDNIVYVQTTESQKILPIMIDDMYEYYETEGEKLNVAKECTICAAKSHDENWYRGFIEKECEDDSKVLVRYIDYGNTEEVPKDNIKYLIEKDCVQSAMATKVYLPIVSTSEEIKTVLAELTIGYTLTLDIIDFVHENWIGDITFENRSVIDVLISKNLVDRCDVSEIKKQIEKDTTDKPRKYIELNANLSIVKENHKTNKLIDLVEGFVAHVDNPESFYIQLATNSNSIEKLHENIQIIAQSLPQLEEFRKGTYCIAKYSVDEDWYRAKIIDFGSDVITIQFIDYGNADVITEKDKKLLKIMPNELKSIEGYAICCSLPIHPKGSIEWSEEAVGIIYNLVNHKAQFEYISRVAPKKYVNLFYNEEDIGAKLITNEYGIEWSVIKTGEKCYISHSNSLSEFYIQLESSTNNLELMSEFLNSDIQRFPVLVDFKEGTICSAQFPEDEEWYRAKIIFHSDEGTEVLFIDYGNTAFTENLREIPKDIADLPIFSKKCSLYLPNYITQWSEEAESQFQVMAAMGLTIFDVEMYAPGEIIVINLYQSGVNIFNTLEPLCKKHNIGSLTESIIEEAILNSGYILNGYEGTVCHINSPNDFYVHLIKDEATLNDITDHLAKQSEKLTDLEDKTIGNLCIAKFPEDELYYRAKIMSDSIDGCDVFYIDYGNVSFSSELKEIPTELASINGLAKHCSLRKFTSCYDNWNESASEFFFQTCGSDQTTFQINIIDKNSDPQVVNLFLGTKNILEEMEKLEINNSNTSDSCVLDIVKDICEKLDLGTNENTDINVTEESEEKSDEIVELDDSFELNKEMLNDIFDQVTKTIYETAIDETAIDENELNTKMINDIIEDATKSCNENLQINNEIELNRKMISEIIEQVTNLVSQRINETSKNLKEEELLTKKMVNDIIEDLTKSFNKNLEIHTEIELNNQMVAEIFEQVTKSIVEYKDDKTEQQLNQEMANEIIEEVFQSIGEAHLT